MTDSIGRSWQLGTVQLDYSMPERFDLAYTGADNAEHRPVMIHRALLGSFERFIGILIEHYAGELPLWLAPVQAIVLPVSDRFNEYGAAVRERLREQGLRVELDDRSESVGRKIRDAELRRVPYMLVVGEREAARGHGVGARAGGPGEHGYGSGASVDELAQRLVAHVRRRASSPSPVGRRRIAAVVSRWGAVGGEGGIGRSSSSALARRRHPVILGHLEFPHPYSVPRHRIGLTRRQDS